MSEDSMVWHDNAIGIVASIKKAAHQQGYAVAWHGSLVKDIDLLAAPWTDDAVEPSVLVERVCTYAGVWVNPQHEQPVQKPHGRQAWSLHVLGTSVWVDFSVMPLLKVS